MIVDWAVERSSLQDAALEYWCTRIKILQATFHDISFDHIYRQLNTVANHLSKRACGL